MSDRRRRWIAYAAILCSTFIALGWLNQKFRKPPKHDDPQLPGPQLLEGPDIVVGTVNIFAQGGVAARIEHVARSGRMGGLPPSADVIAKDRDLRPASVSIAKREMDEWGARIFVSAEAPGSDLVCMALRKVALPVPPPGETLYDDRIYMTWRTKTGVWHCTIRTGEISLVLILDSPLDTPLAPSQLAKVCRQYFSIPEVAQESSAENLRQTGDVTSGRMLFRTPATRLKLSVDDRDLSDGGELNHQYWWWQNITLCTDGTVWCFNIVMNNGWQRTWKSIYHTLLFPD